ncbi:hypothetical protein ACIP5Y_26585 [Nocardia sp. NPDC088792]|uniref:hypothetical protein n=1 Tax=Nocardia sp. NPDC088792 TaxID=3364332 RepID=UPI00380B3F28
MVSEQQVRDKISEYEATIARHRLDGLDLTRMFDLDTTARRALQTSRNYDDDQLVRANTHGFLNMRFTVHLSAQAVGLFNTAADTLSSALRSVIGEIPELAIICVPLLAFIMGESGAIKSVAAASESGAVALEGVFPSPVIVPFPEGRGFWPDKPPPDPGTGHSGSGDSPGGSGNTDSGDDDSDDGWDIDDDGRRKGPGDIWDPGDV